MEKKKGAYLMTHSQEKKPPKKGPEFFMFGNWEWIFSIAGKDNLQLEKSAVCFSVATLEKHQSKENWHTLMQ